MPSAKIGVRAARAVRRHPRLYKFARSVYERINSWLPARTLDGIPGPVHRNDLMLPVLTEEFRQNYVRSGRTAVKQANRAIEDVGGRLEDSDVLDFGSGYGRVVRQLVGRTRSVTACDVDARAVAFCARAFGAIPIRGSYDVDVIPLGFYDATWVGSVLTHLSPSKAQQLLIVLFEHLKPGGVLVVTSNGPEMLLKLIDKFQWMRPHEMRLLSEMEREGATYADYPQSIGTYGLGFQTDAWLEQALAETGARLLFHHRNGWDIQNVHAWHRPPE